jgi:hypothetical protein
MAESLKQDLQKSRAVRFCHNMVEKFPEAANFYSGSIENKNR